MTIVDEQDFFIFAAKTSRTSPLPTVLRRAHEISSPSGSASIPLCNPDHLSSLDFFFVSNLICILFYPHGSPTLLISSNDPDVSTITLSFPRPVCPLRVRNPGDSPHRATGHCVETTMDVVKRSFTVLSGPCDTFRLTDMFTTLANLPRYILLFGIEDVSDDVDDVAIYQQLLEGSSTNKSPVKTLASRVCMFRTCSPEKGRVHGEKGLRQIYT